MTREEAIEHFEENYLYKYSVKLEEILIDYLEKNREVLFNQFKETCKKIFIKIKEMQDKGIIGKTDQIIFSWKPVDVLKGYKYMDVNAYEESGYYDIGAECKVLYDVSWACDFYEEICEELNEKRKLYIGVLGQEEMDSFRISTWTSCITVIRDYIIKEIIDDIVEMEEYRAFDKAEVMDIRIGLYMGMDFVMYRHDSREKDPEKIKKLLESEKRLFLYEVLRGLDLSGGNYYNNSFNHADLRGSNLSNCNLQECTFIEANLQNVRFQNSNLKGAMLAKAILENSDFRNAVLENTFFAFSNMMNTNLKGLEISNCIFTESNLRNANLEGCKFTATDFIKANLIGAKLDGAKFENCKFREMKISKKDLDKFILSEEEKAGIEIVE